MKTDLLLFSDFHAHNFPFAAKRVPIEGFYGLYNSRLRDSVAVLDYIHAYAYEHDIHHILFGGDLFHRRTSVNTDVRAVVWDKLLEFAYAPNNMFTLDLLVGNHDMGDKHGNVHSLKGLECVRNTMVMERVSGVQRGHVFVVCVPFTPSIDEAKEWLARAGEMADRFREVHGGPSILMAHLGMQGAKVGSDYVLIGDSDIQVADVPHEKFAACFFGHFHQHQQLFANGWFIGATHEHNWGDVGGKRGFLHVTVEDDKVSFKRVETEAPKFVVVREGDNVVPRSQDFVKYIGSTEFVESVEETGAHVQRLVEKTEDTLDFALDVDKLDPMSMLEAWVDAHGPDDLDRDELLKRGHKLLSQVQS